MNSKQGALAPGLEQVCARLWPRPAIIAIVVAYGVLLARSGWIADISAGWGDPDAMMRLAEVRDLLAGQAWYDLAQHRLAPPLGVLSHWSRLVDAPIAALILAFTPFAGRAGAELLAINLWPLLVYPAFAAGLVSLARRFAGWTGALFALVLFGLSPPLTDLFRPGDIDHHNVQAVLVIWLAVGLTRADASRRAAALAGLAAALSLGVGLETLLAVLLALFGLVLAWTVDGDRWRGGLIVCALTFTAATAAIFLFQVPPDRWGVAACDALSPVYLVLAAVGGLGISLIALVLRGRDDGMPGLMMRGGALLALGSVLVSVTALLFPACLAGPYAQVDPRLGPIWLDHVSEAQSFLATLADRPQLVPPLYLAPFAALLLGLFGLRLVAGRDRPAFAMLISILAGSLVLGLLQLRAVVGAEIVAAAVAGVVAALSFARTADRSDLRAVALRWSFVAAAPLLWHLAAAPLVGARAGETAAAAVATENACRTGFAEALAALPPGVVVSTSNFGSFLIEATPHSALAAPYHRNAAGLIAANAILSAADGRAEFTAAGGRYLALCLGDPEVAMIAERAPEGLAARLKAGQVPDWLAPLAAIGAARVWTLAAPPAASAPSAPDITGSLPPPELRPSLAD